MIIDSHVHIWVQQPDRYPWSPVGGYVPNNEASVETLLKVMDLYNIEGAVLVQPTPYGWDNRYLLDSAKKAPKRFRTVCLVNPMGQDSADEMKKLVEQSGVNGFRFNWHLRPLEEWGKNQNHHLLWQMAGDLKCPLCIQCTLEYLPQLQKMAKEFPNDRIIIDHFGKPVISLGIQQQMFQHLLSLSKLPNVYIKLSGFYYASAQTAPYSDVSPFVQAIISSFGAQKCMWGSDFPFVMDRWKYASSLNWINTLASLSDSERSWILGNTAKSIWW